jgi:glucan biosynthesis protein C
MLVAQQTITTSKEPKVKIKDLNIETLRGIAIVLMVLGHVIGQLTLSGIKLKDDSALQFMSYAFQYIRMPLFTIISGYVYAFKPVNRFSSSKQFMSRKLERLFIPFLIVPTLSYITRYLTPGLSTKVNLGGLWETFLFPTGQFWFIQAMVIMFVILVIIEKLKLLETLKSALVVLAACILWFSVDIKTALFSIDKVPFLLTFFIVGVVFKRFKSIIFTKKITLIATVVLCAALAFQLAVFNNTTLSRFIPLLLTLVVGTTASLFLIHSGFSNGRLIWLGNFSYGIYLFHMFGVSGFRLIALKVFHIDSIAVHVIGGLICGVALPIVLELLVPKRSLLSLLFFGNKFNFKKDSQNSSVPQAINNAA